MIQLRPNHETKAALARQLNTARRQASNRDILTLLELFMDRSRRSQLMRPPDGDSGNRAPERDAEPQVAPTVIESISNRPQISADLANSLPAPIPQVQEASEIGRTFADALRVVIQGRRERQFSMSAAIEELTRERRRPSDNETARQPPVAMPAIANDGGRGENSTVDARFVDRSSTSRASRDASPKRELVARIELDDKRLAEETSGRIAEEIAAREAALVERIERLVERKLDSLSRKQVQRHRGIEATVRMQ